MTTYSDLLKKEKYIAIWFFILCNWVDFFLLNKARNDNGFYHKRPLHFWRICSRLRRGIREHGGSDIPFHDNMVSDPRGTLLTNSRCRYCMNLQTAKIQ